MPAPLSRVFPRSVLSHRPALVGALLLGLLPLAACDPITPHTSPGTTAIYSNRPCDESTQWQPPSNNAQLDDFVLTGPSTGWAVGASASGNGVGVIFHLANGQWQQLPQTYPGEELTSIAMASPTDGWIAAYGARNESLHYAGGAWREVDVPALDAAYAPPDGVSAPTFQPGAIQLFGSNAGWFFGQTDVPRAPNSSSTKVVTLRYTAGTWTPTPAPNAPDAVTLFDFAATSADEAWLLGTDYETNGQTTVLYHYLRGQWSQWPTTYPGISQQLQMLSPTNGWLFAGDGSSPQTPSTLLHYDGTTWTPVNVAPAEQLVGQIDYLRAIGEPTPGTIWFQAYTHAQASNFAAPPTLLAYNVSSSQWQRVSWPYSGQELDRIIGTASGDLYGIGDIAHQRGCPPLATGVVDQGIFYHYTEDQWHETILP